GGNRVHQISVPLFSSVQSGKILQGYAQVLLRHRPIIGHLLLGSYLKRLTVSRARLLQILLGLIARGSAPQFTESIAQRSLDSRPMLRVLITGINLRRVEVGRTCLIQVFQTLFAGSLNAKRL